MYIIIIDHCFSWFLWCVVTHSFLRWSSGNNTEFFGFLISKAAHFYTYVFFFSIRPISSLCILMMVSLNHSASFQLWVIMCKLCEKRWKQCSNMEFHSFSVLYATLTWTYSAESFHHLEGLSIFRPYWLFLFWTRSQARLLLCLLNSRLQKHQAILHLHQRRLTSLLHEGSGWQGFPETSQDLRIVNCSCFSFILIWIHILWICWLVNLYDKFLFMYILVLL